MLEIILLGAFAGWLASVLLKRNKTGILTNILIGIIGSFIGRHIFDFLGLTTKNVIGTFVMTLVGAVVLLWLINLLQKK